MENYSRNSIILPVSAYLKDPEKILVIEGVRQTGKTTALKQATLGMAAHFITLTDETPEVSLVRDATTFTDFQHHLKTQFGFIPDGKTALIIDEAQKSPFLHLFIMQMEREWKRVLVILAGSVMGVFFRRSAAEKNPSAAGRVRRLVCRPFSFFEFLDWLGESSLMSVVNEYDFARPFPQTVHTRLMTLFYDYLTCGGMPEAIKKRQDISALYDYWQTLLSFFWQDTDRYLSELLQNNKRQYGALFDHVMRAIARLTTQPSTRGSLVSTDSPSYRHELPALLDAAEEWHFVFRLLTTMKTHTTKPGTNSKKYLWDVGVVNHFLNMSRQVSSASPPDLLARLMETFVAQELVFHLGNRERLQSWKSHHKQGKEMDFLARFPRGDVGVEVKAASTINQKAISQLAEYLKTSDTARGLVVYTGEPVKVHISARETLCVPPYFLGRSGTIDQL